MRGLAFRRAALKPVTSYLASMLVLGQFRACELDGLTPHVLQMIVAARGGE
jgi:hypothetical protein